MTCEQLNNDGELCGGEIIRSRVKDVHYDCDEGECTITIYIIHCSECGNVNEIVW